MDRRLEPYGLVLRGGRWYLVAGPGPRTYRVDQILDLTPLKESLTIPESFSLAGYWQSYTADFLAGLHRADAVVRLTPAAVARLTGRDADAVAATGIREPDGWTRAVLPIEGADLAVRGFLTPDVEVLEPPELRVQVAARARAIAALYELRASPGRHRSPEHVPCFQTLQDSPAAVPATCVSTNPRGDDRQPYVVQYRGVSRCSVGGLCRVAPAAREGCAPQVQAHQAASGRCSPCWPGTSSS